MAVTASAASGPSALISTSQPVCATSIMRSMIERASAVSPSCETMMRDSNSPARRDRRAEARACRPLRLTMVARWLAVTVSVSGINSTL